MATPRSPAAPTLDLDRLQAEASAPLRPVHTTNFPALLRQLGASLLVTTYQAGKLELTHTSEAETITGPKAGVTISGGGLSRVFQVDGGATASMSGLTITGGSAVTSAAGCIGAGTVNLQSCAVTSSQANGTVLGEGGGIYSYCSVVTLVAGSVSGNKGTTGHADIFVGP
jgi:hypothetical protein